MKSDYSGLGGMPAAILVYGVPGILVIVISSQPASVVLPLVSMMLTPMGFGAAFYAWSCSPSIEEDQVNYWDLAGALIFLGFGACSLSGSAPSMLIG